MEPCWIWAHSSQIHQATAGSQLLALGSVLPVSTVAHRYYQTLLITTVGEAINYHVPHSQSLCCLNFSVGSLLTPLPATAAATQAL